MQSSDIPDDEVSLQDLWRVLVQYKAWVLGFPVLAMILAAVTVSLIKPQWEAVALVRIGAVGQVGQVGQTIEPAAQLVERMKLKAFRDAILINLGLPIDTENPDTRLYQESLQVKPLRSVDLIELRVRSFTQVNALRYMNATIDSLKKSHNERTAPEIKRLQRVLQRSEKEIAQFQLLRDKFVKLLEVKEKAGFMENVVLSNNIVKLDEMLLNLKRTKDHYEFLLDPMQTFPTAVLDKVSLSFHSLARKKTQIILMAGVLGLILGVGGVLFSHTQRFRAQ